MEKHEQNDLTLEDVLEEYTDEPEAPAEPEISPEKQAVAEALAHARESKPLRPQDARKIKKGRTKVNFLQSEASETEQIPMRVNVPSGTRQEEPRPVRNFSDDSPKIRRMSDSTRAREIEKIKKKNQKNKKNKSARIVQEEQPYAKERPEGDYMYTQIHGAKKAQKRKKVKRTPEVGAVRRP